MGVIAEPPQLDPIAGIAALEEDMPRVLAMIGVNSIEDLGWRRSGKATLLVPMRAERGGRVDEFLLRLGFEAYRRWPPSALFVNPETLCYQQGRDERHVPRLTSPECQTHTAYDIPGGGKTQLVCCSATMEFYVVRHDVDPKHLWNEKNNFYATIRAIERSMLESYQGRFE